jgi:uncharacterized membrane protein
MLALYLMAAIYLVAGVLHFTRFRFFRWIMPPWVPFPTAVVYWSGVVEIILGITLLIPATRSIAAGVLMVFLVLIFPANIYMAVGEKFRKKISPIALWLRLPLQGLLIWWAYQYVK